MVAVRRDESQDEAGRERAQHHIKQEQERQTQFAEQFNGFGHPDFIYAEWSEYRPEHQQQHGLRHGFAGNKLRDDRTRHCNHHDDGKRDEIIGHGLIEFSPFS